MILMYECKPATTPRRGVSLRGKGLARRQPLDMPTGIHSPDKTTITTQLQVLQFSHSDVKCGARHGAIDNHSPR